MTTCQCPGCDKPIPAYRGPLAKYCTPQCASRAKYLHSREGVVIVIGTPRECLWCKAPFTSRSHNQHFCSTDCYQTYWRQPENKRRRKQGSGPDAGSHLTALGAWNTPEERAQLRTEAARIEAVVAEAAANGTIGSITPGRSASDDRALVFGGWKCKRVG